MAFNVRATLEKVQSYLVSDGGFKGATIGEPKSLAVGTEIAAAVFMRGVSITKFFVNGGTEETHTVNVRLYRDMLMEPTKDMEIEVAVAVQRIVSDLLGDFDLGGTIRNVDGVNVRTDWGYGDVGGKMYRIADITLPLIVDDSATAAP